MVQREVTLTFGELLRQPLIEDYVTLTCVSDPVGGPYAGNARWLGARLADLIRQARPLAGASQLLCTSVDGFTSGTPLQVVLDGRDALLAVAMNGQPLPVAHGFPARMVVPGLYGYVSATKWVTDIEVTTFAAASAYWVQRGWSQQAPIKTESRIDVPAANATLAPGRTPVAGVAWAQHKGVAAVEVRVDRGPWHEAKLAAVPDIDTWRQWVWMWDAAPGNHLLEARATDATGYTQTAVTAPPTPNGASGYPSAAVTVRASLRLGRKTRRRDGQRGRPGVRDAGRRVSRRPGGTPSGRGHRPGRPPVRRPAARRVRGRAGRRAARPGRLGRPAGALGRRRAVGRAPGRRRDDGRQRGTAGVRARRTGRTHLEPAPGQPGAGHLPAAGQGFRPAARPACLGRGPAVRGSRRPGRGPAAARADAQGPHRNRHRAVRRHDRAGQRPDRRRARGRSRVRRAAGRGAPGRPRGAGRAPGLAGRPPRRGGARTGRRPGPADRARAVRPQALPRPERGRGRGRRAGPGRGRPGPGQRADRRARRPDGRAGRAAGSRGGAAGARPAGRRRARRRDHPRFRPGRAGRPDRVRDRPASWSRSTTIRSR